MTATESSFDRANWPPAGTRLAAAVAALVLAGALWAIGGFWRLGAALVVADTAVALLPWRYPRSARSTVSIWAEALLYLGGPWGLVVAAGLSGQGWLARMPSIWWWPVAVAVAAALIWVGGMPLRTLVSGDLAFLAPTVSRRHKAARCVSVAAAPPGEEVMYRAPLLSVHGGLLPFAGAAGAAAFVARHHLAPGMAGRTTRRMVAAQLGSALALGAMTLISHSLYPALLTHVLNNVPSFLLEITRATHD